MLAEGFTTRRGRHGALIYHDAVNHEVRAAAGSAPHRAHLRRHDPRQRPTTRSSSSRRRSSSARSTRTSRSRACRATCSSSATSPTASCASSRAASAWRTRRRSRPRSRSGSARPPGAATSCPPACRGCARRSSSAPGRTGIEATTAWLIGDAGLYRAGRGAARRATWPRARAALGALPTQHTIIFERFFDEAGGMQLVIHSPFGSRINRAWGLALRKRFCRSFNFELQAAATEDTHHPLAHHRAQLRARRGRALPAFQHRAAAAGAGAVRCADVPGALALERHHRAGAAALPRRQEGARAAARAWPRRTC